MKTREKLPVVLEAEFYYSKTARIKNMFSYTAKSANLSTLSQIMHRVNWRMALLILAIYNVLVIINIPQIYINNALSSQPVKWWIPIVQLFWGYNLWTIVTPVILWLGCNFPIGRRHFLRNLALHLFASIFAGLFIHVCDNFGAWILGTGKAESFWGMLSNVQNLVRYISGALVHYPVVIITQKAYLHYREAQDRAFRLQQAELEVLKTQLQPHFLFNTLNAISALVFIAPKIATETISQLSDLLRLALSTGKTQEVTLKEELDFLRKYIQIQQTLLQERLTVKWEIAYDTLDAMIPNMLLQPLVENSIKHGIAPKEKGGEIEIHSQRTDNNLRLEVRDNGLGLAENSLTDQPGIGLENMTMRLRYLYGEDHEIRFIEPPGGGLTVSLIIPFTEQEN